MEWKGLINGWAPEARAHPINHNITITGKVQDIGFRNTIEHIWRLFGLPDMVFNANADIKEQTLSVYAELPDNFTEVSSDDDIDIGRKLDKLPKGYIL